MKYFVLIALLVSCLGCSDEDVVDPHLFKTIDIPKGSGAGLRICVSPKGSRFASGIGKLGSEMNIWNCEGFLEETFSKREDNLVTYNTPSDGPIYGIVFTPDWKYFATYQNSRLKQSLVIWGNEYFSRDKVYKSMSEHEVNLVTFDTKGERLAYVDKEALVHKFGRIGKTHQVTIRSGENFRESVTLDNDGFVEPDINLLAL